MTHSYRTAILRAVAATFLLARCTATAADPNHRSILTP